MWKIIACAVGLALIGSSAVAQTQCNERAEVLKLLAQKYKEAPIAAGVTSTGGLVEVLTNGKGETWTIIVTSPEGTSCLVAAGEGWQAREQTAIILDPEA